MSYDLGLYKTRDSFDDPAEVTLFAEGGTQALGGSTDAELNITYNYSKFFYEYLDKESGLRWLYGRQAKDCVDRLRFAVIKLGTDRDSDYWKPTPGNAGYALNILLEWALQHPKAYFNGD